GPTTVYHYDGLGRVDHIVHTAASGAALGDFGTVYDVAGRAQSDTSNRQAQSYTYDATDQLLSDGLRAYSYDANGNRTGVIGPGNQLLSYGGWDYTYDAEGNRTSQTRSDGSEQWTYGYDNANQLVWAEQRVPDWAGGGDG